MQTEFIVGVLVFVFLLYVFVWGMKIGADRKEAELKKTILSKENVVACFKDVDWQVQTFTYVSNGVGSEAQTQDGVKHFYKAPSIQEAIKKLNKLLNQGGIETKEQQENG